jgi:hypothetical protein
MKLIDNCLAGILLTTFLFAQINYENDIQPIFNANCTGCHPGNAGLNLTELVSYDNLVNVISLGYAPALRVKPGEPSESVLWNKVAGTNVYGQQMPQGGSLTLDEISLIENWISEGALLDVSEESGLPSNFALHQNYPNPFNPTTTLSFTINRSETVELTVMNLLGQKLRTLKTGRLDPGTHLIHFDGRDEAGNVLSGGVYLYSISTSSWSDTKKMILLK